MESKNFIFVLFWHVPFNFCLFDEDGSFIGLDICPKTKPFLKKVNKIWSLYK